jgi:hypothetical protein
MRIAPALWAELSSNGDAERAAAPDVEALRALEIFDMGAVTRDMVTVCEDGNSRRDAANGGRCEQWTLLLFMT